MTPPWALRPVHLLVLRGLDRTPARDVLRATVRQLVDDGLLTLTEEDAPGGRRPSDGSPGTWCASAGWSPRCAIGALSTLMGHRLVAPSFNRWLPQFRPRHRRTAAGEAFLRQPSHWTGAVAAGEADLHPGFDAAFDAGLGRGSGD